MSDMIAPDPAIGTKVVCAYPVAVIWQNILGYLVLPYAITQFFRIQVQQEMCPAHICL